MRTPTQSEIDRLTNAAAAWVGTPFCANSRVLGAGVSCHQYVAAIYEDAGWTPTLPIPEGSPTWNRAQARSLMEAWLDGDGARWFARASIDGVQPGDLLGFRLGPCIHHLAVMLDRGMVAHAVKPHGAQVVAVAALPAAWANRLAAAWRPILA